MSTEAPTTQAPTSATPTQTASTPSSADATTTQAQDGGAQQTQAKPDVVDPASESLFAKKDETDGDTKTDVEPDKKEGDAEGEDADGEGSEKPIEYQDFAMPEGFTPDAQLLNNFKELGVKSKIPQETAQELVNLFADHQKKSLESYVQERRAWREEVKNDPELGGHNLKGTLQNIEALVQKFATNSEGVVDQSIVDGMQENLIFWGMGDRLSFLKFLNNIHKATSEDKADGKPGTVTTAQKSTAQAIWGNMPGDKK